MCANFINFLYLIASICFIVALKGLSDAKTARNGNVVGIIGMAVALIAVFCDARVSNYVFTVLAILAGGTIGIFIAKKIEMTALPQLIAGFHSFVGLAAVFVAVSAYMAPEVFGIVCDGAIKMSSLIEMSIGAAIGAITFTGSLVAFGKLQGILGSKPIMIPERHLINSVLGISIILLIVIFCATASMTSLFGIILASFALGLLLIIPIGGADMPVIISMLNSYSGWAASGIGFTLGNTLLIITGALVGSSGAILSYVMCKAMNRSIFNVILGGFGSQKSDKTAEGTTEKSDKPVAEKSDTSGKLAKEGNALDVAKLLKGSKSVIIVPGYGMAVAHAQHAIKEIVDFLKKNNVRVRFAIHPVAGRMPGHMNVLLAEANIDYDDIVELEEINDDFKNTDLALVIGANDVTNPAAKTNTSSPIYGMPILDVESAKNIVFIKRSLSSGYSGVDNELFYNPKTVMLYGDAKKVAESLVKEFDNI